MNMHLSKLTLNEMTETRKQLNNLVAGIAGSNQIYDINQKLDALDSFFAQFEKRGGFDLDQVRIRGGWNTIEKNNKEKRDDSDSVLHARVIVARSGLKLLQQAIPALKKICDRCLEVAGKDAVRQACTPAKMEGTDLNGQPYAPLAPEFTLPEGYETLTQKLKSVIGG